MWPPPQAQISGSCHSPFKTRRSTKSFEVTFNGAAGATYTQSFLESADPTHLTVVSVDSQLSVSQIIGANGADCTFVGSDGQETETHGSDTAIVHTPQVMKYGWCLGNS